ncbi:hypothetical protein PGTUg99_026924 [Puccinia graminis f. sp. tritici]|uniref:Uncharacterized protein n=1 Tax=Puccinia graminis f. sp. tritici TaxID=56615 RepID=A0A5B0R6U1_PUCGR|nr:hypothetical protein PGTUg99_026924 [Puccinia graminis f. sp. tritici]
MNKEHQQRTSNHQNRRHSLNPSKLKSLTENLRLRLKYAKLKVINGWHNQTLNEIESTFYYLKLPPNQQQQQQQQTNKPTLYHHHQSSSPSTSTTISAPSSSSCNFSAAPQHPNPFKLPNIPASTIPQLSRNSPIHSIRSHHLQLKQQAEQSFSNPGLISSTNTTFSLPSKYSTPFRKIIRTGGTANEQLMTNQSNIFWPTGPMSSSSTLGSPSSSSKMIKSSHSSKRNWKSPEGLYFKLGGTTVERLKNSQHLDSKERGDLFKDSMDEYNQELYKHSSPASFLFNNHYRPLRGSCSSSSSASKPTPSRTFFNHPLDLLNSISPVRIRSHLPNDLHRPPAHQTLVKLAASSLVSPSPNRTQSHLSKIFGSTHPDQAPREDDNDQEDLDEDEDEDEEDKENLLSNSESTSQSRPANNTLPARSSPIKFSIRPRPPRLNSLRSLDQSHNPPPQPDHHEVEEATTGVDQIGLDDLDQMNWE